MNINKININQSELTYGIVASDNYDVTANNDGVTFSSLSTLLSAENLSTLIPTAVRCGGMTIRFVQSTNNKYVQYRLMTTSFSTTESDWQGVDDEPTHESDNLVKSGGVALSLTKLNEDVQRVRNVLGEKVEKNYTYIFNSSTSQSTRTVLSNISLRKGHTYIFSLSANISTNISVKQISLSLRHDEERLAFKEAVVGNGVDFTSWDGSPKQAFIYTADNDYDNCNLLSFMNVQNDFNLTISIKSSYQGNIQDSIQEINANLYPKINIQDIYKRIKLSEEAVPDSIVNGYLNIQTSEVVSSETSQIRYYTESIIVKACVSRGGLTAVISYLDSNDKVIGIEALGDYSVRYNIVGDIKKYENCVKLAVCYSTGTKCIVLPLTSNNFVIKDYLSDGNLFNGYLDENGLFCTIDSCVCSDYIKVTIGDTFILNGYAGENSAAAFYDNNKTFKIKGGLLRTGGIQYFCSPVDGYMRVYARHQMSTDEQYPSLIKGESPLTEENIIWKHTGYYLDSNGNDVQAQTYIYLMTSDFIRIKLSTEYIHFYSIVATPSTGDKAIFFYNNAQQFISAITVKRLFYRANDYWAADYILHISDIPDGAVFYKVVGIDECADSEILQKAPITYLDTRIFNVPSNFKHVLELQNSKIANIGPSSSVYPATMAWKNIVKLNTGVEITDYGVGGTGASNQVTVTNNYQRQVDSLIESGIQYDYIFLWLSGNDFDHNAQIGNIDSYTTKDGYSEDALSTVCGGINYCIKRLSEELPNARIIAFSPITTFISDAYWDPSTTKTNSIGKRLMEYVEAGKSVCDNKHIPWYSLRNMGINEFNYTNYFRKDNLHLNISGNKFLIPYVMKALSEHLKY